MAVQWIVCLLCCHLVLATASNSLGKDDKNPKKIQLPIPKAGIFENCGKPGTDIGISFTPGILRFGDTISIDAHIKPSVDLQEGYASLSIFIGDEVEPIYQTPPNQGHFTCDDIHKYIPTICPFYKNKRNHIEGYKYYVSPSLGLPAGDFRFLLTIQDMNRKNSMCLYGHLVILDD